MPPSIVPMPSLLNCFFDLTVGNIAENEWMYLRARTGYKILRNFESSIHHWKKYCFVRSSRGWGFDPKWSFSRTQDNNDLVNLTKDENQDFFRLRALQGRYGSFNAKLLTREQLLVEARLSRAHVIGSFPSSRFLVHSFSSKCFNPLFNVQIEAYQLNDPVAAMDLDWALVTREADN